MYQELPQFENWLKCQYSNSSASIHYSSDLALFFSYIKKPPSEITPQNVDRYVSHSLRQKHCPSTINRRLSALRTFYYFLSITCDSPSICPVLPRHRLRKSHPLPRAVSDSDINSLFTRMDNVRDKAVFLLMLGCGLRVGEVHHLSIDDIFFEDPPRLVVHGKGGKQRIMYLLPPTQEALQYWLASRPVSNERAVFVSEHGKRLSVAGIQYLLRGYCEKASIKLTAHQLRHTFGRRMAEAHLPLTSLQSLLGHKDVRTTQIYVHLTGSHLQAEYDRAISTITAPSAARSSNKNIKSQHFLKAKAVNYSGYLDKLPGWLAELIHTHSSRYSQAQDLIQQTRNRLSQLTSVLRWMVSHHAITCSTDITPNLWFAFAEIRLKAGIKPASLNTTIRILQSFLKFVRDTGHPICERMLEVRPLRTGVLLPRAITETQLHQLLELADPFDYTWILLMAHSGLRTCEIRNLRWKDIDVRRRTVRIESSKDLRSRIVFISAPAVDVLQQLLNTSKYVFTHNNRPLSSRYCQFRLKTLGKKCDLNVTPHQLRHTCATTLLNLGMSIFGVQTILGHKYVDTTLRYARVHNSVVAKDYRQAMETIQQKKSDRSVPW